MTRKGHRNLSKSRPCQQWRVDKHSRWNFLRCENFLEKFPLSDFSHIFSPLNFSMRTVPSKRKYFISLGYLFFVCPTFSSYSSHTLTPQSFLARGWKEKKFFKQININPLNLKWMFLEGHNTKARLPQVARRYLLELIQEKNLCHSCFMERKKLWQAFKKQKCMQKFFLRTREIGTHVWCP